MKQDGKIWIFYGNGQGKSAAGMGAALDAAANGHEAVVIQFLKGQYSEEFMKRFEPELKVFRTARNEKSFTELSEEERSEEVINIRNGLSLARKFLTTDACELLVLDEVTGLINEGLIIEEELEDILLKKKENQTVILTGTILPEGAVEMCDNIINVTREK
ncbi:MAG: cob(I)yrinic acid a,c-diamide adenosyltransferase [Lachnospiraceae bacterium]|nr:cob(I)yrinic acid a,c-diamide adenosyltransferase [Lachnospiraceae bacterium]